MGISLSAIQAMLGLWKDDHFQNANKVLEIGSQELHLTYDDFETALTSYGVDAFDPNDFSEWGWEDRGKCYYADKLYSMLGVKEYMCFDINAENKAIAHDLNLPFEDKSHWGEYDIVTDFGCAEHVFNVSEVFRTMHNTCRTGGVFLHCQQMYNTNGYYMFEPAFYEDLAASNGYEILFSCFMVSKKTMMKDSGKNSWILPLSSELLDTLDWTKLQTISLFYAMKKVNDAEFKTPYQEALMSHVYGNKGYEVANLSNYLRPTRTYVPVLERKEDISSREFKRVCRAYFKKKLGFIK